VDSDRCPIAAVPRVRPRIVFPCLVAELARLWNGVKNPEALAGADVEPSNVTFDVFLGPGRTARQVCGADHHDISTDHGRRVDADVSSLEIDVWLIDLSLQIDDAGRPE